MSHLERGVHITHKHYKIRDTAKSAYAARYPEAVKPYMEIIEAVAKGEGASVMVVAQHMAKEMGDAGHSPLMVLAAMVELLEPSPEVLHA